MYSAAKGVMDRLTEGENDFLLAVLQCEIDCERGMQQGGMLER
jgi:hypothetical protein